MFLPYMWAIIRFNLTYRAAIQDIWGVILGYWGFVIVCY